MTESISASAEAMCHVFCENEMRAWTGRRIDRAAQQAEAQRLNANTYSVFLLHLDGTSAELLAKPDHRLIPILTGRADTYRAFLASVVAMHPVPHPVTIAIEVGDQPLNGEFPFFSFQKIEGDPTILLPDVNLLEGEFYEGDGFLDTTPFSGKADKAVFVGSTSGADNTLKTLAAGRNQRIEAALFFKDRGSVDFWLPNVVQSDEEATVKIRSLGIGDRIVGWHEQFGYKFLLSLDGNGAACQRLAVALKSNCVVLKYASRSILHYFHGLVPGTHFIPVSENSDVIDIVECRSRDDYYESVAEGGKAFFERYLSRNSTRMYVAMLLDRYAGLQFD